MKKCPHCGAELNDEDLFCDKCGYKLQENKICQECGAELKQDSSFCPKCGAKVFTEYDQEKLINRYRNEIANFRRKKSLLIKDAFISLALGSLFLIVSLVLVFVVDFKGSAAVFCSLGFAFAFIFVIVGIALSIVQSAVFDNRINNRIIAINKLTSTRGGMKK